MSKVNITKSQEAKNILGLRDIVATLHKKVKLYKKRAKEVELYLNEHPEEWGKFQSEFNEELNGIFKDIMLFERSNMEQGNEEKVKKLKDFFIRRFRNDFRKGLYCEWSINKPYGYAGDFNIIDHIYRNTPSTTGFDRLFDNYFQMSAISIAVRNRKEDVKRIIGNFIKERSSSRIAIMNLASGSAREIKEILSDKELCSKNVLFDCYDHEQKAIDFAKDLLSEYSNVKFFRQDALKIINGKGINNKAGGNKYDMIYSLGLYDYFKRRVSTRLTRNLKHILNDKGVLIVSSVRDKYSNPSIYFMEWAGNWNLFYRSEDEFKRIFIDAGFKENDVKISYEQQGIMQYITAVNNQE